MPATKPFGLVLAGGLSSRMGSDKSQIIYPKISLEPQRVNTLHLLLSCELESFLSCRKTQLPTEPCFEGRMILDRADLSGGPGVGILSAHLAQPTASWLVIACDFPFVTETAIADLIHAYQALQKSICYRHNDGTLEPLFSVWTPEDLHYFHIRFLAGSKSPKRALEEKSAASILPADQKILENINSPAEAAAHPELMK